MPFVQMENISQFLTTVSNPPISLPPHDRFLTVDLYEKKDPAQVIQCLGAFSRVAHNIAPDKFPETVGGLKSSGALLSALSPAGTASVPWTAPGQRSVSGGGGPPTPGKHAAVSAWSKPDQKGSTQPAWNVSQYGYMGGASQGNQGIMFGGRRQITATPPAGGAGLTAEENERRRKVEAEERGRLMRQNEAEKEAIRRKGEANNAEKGRMERDVGLRRKEKELEVEATRKEDTLRAAAKVRRQKEVEMERLHEERRVLEEGRVLEEHRVLEERRELGERRVQDERRALDERQAMEERLVKEEQRLEQEKLVQAGQLKERERQAELLAEKRRWAEEEAQRTAWKVEKEHQRSLENQREAARVEEEHTRSNEAELQRERERVRELERELEKARGRERKYEAEKEARRREETERMRRGAQETLIMAYPQQPPYTNMQMTGDRAMPRSGAGNDRESADIEEERRFLQGAWARQSIATPPITEPTDSRPSSLRQPARALPTPPPRKLPQTPQTPVMQKGWDHREEEAPLSPESEEFQFGFSKYVILTRIHRAVLTFFL